MHDTGEVFGSMSVAVIGVDEVGLGALSGPVVAAAVVLNELDGLKDSKKLTEKSRILLSGKIMEAAPYWVIAQSNARTINRYGIAPCHMACIEAVVKIARRFHPDEEIIVDGNTSIIGIGEHTTMVKADETVPAVSAASIIAKVYRDNLMIDLAAEYPRYGWERNKGYGTQEHLRALDEHGVTKQHRKAYKPVRRALLRRH